eukprot:GFYU01005382.1.p1 GENE.GFYU01005382.1~~GFYU01005382.1.p1  ORF type:complete len:322 (-),score=91.04 GFYU01005382.1:148-1113(-)
MFSLMKNFYNWTKKRKEKTLTIVLVGLNNAGKTTLVHTLKGENAELTIPTIGFNSEISQRGKYTINYFDVGGGPKIRGIWKEYFHEAFGFIFVVDSADAERLDEAKKALTEQCLAHDRFKGKPILVFANKKDLPESLPAADIMVKLELDTVKECPHHIEHISALKDPQGNGISNGLKWLLDKIDRDYDEIRQRVETESAAFKAAIEAEKKARRERVEKMKAERRRQQEEEERLANAERSDAEQEKQDEPSKATPAPAAQPQGEDPIRDPTELIKESPRDKQELNVNVTTPRKKGEFALPNSLATPTGVPDSARLQEAAEGQ